MIGNLCGRAEGNPAKDRRRQSTQVGRVNPVLVVVNEDVAKHERFHLIHRHAADRDLIEQFLLERGEKALHPGIVIAMADAAEALNNAAVLQCLPKCAAGVLAAPVGVEDGAADGETAGGCLERVDAQLLAHIVCHAQGKDFTVEAVHDRRDIEPAVNALDLRDVRQQLSKRPVRVEVLAEQILCRHCQRACFRQPFRPVPAFVQPAVLAHQTGQPPQAAGNAALRQRQPHPARTVVAVIWVFVQDLLDFSRKKLIPARHILAFQIAVIS